MAEIKRTFLKSKMNKDLDERLVPSGEYRDALNIEVTTSEGANVGSVQNLKGNINTTVVDHNGFSLISGSRALSSNATTIGVHADDSTKAIYNFIHLAQDLVANGIYVGGTRFTGVKSDCITEFKPYLNQDGGGTRPIVVDVFEARSAATPFVAGDNDRIISGLETVFTDSSVQGSSSVPAGIRVGMRVRKVNLDGAAVDSDNTKIYVKKILGSDEANGKIEVTGGVFIPYTQVDLDTGVVFKFTAERVLNFEAGVNKIEENTDGTPSTKTPEDKIISSINLVDDILYYTDNRTEPKRISLTRFREKLSFIYKHSSHIWKDVSGTFVKTPLEESLITVIRKNPLTPPVVETITTTRQPIAIRVNNADDYGDFGNIVTQDEQGSATAFNYSEATTSLVLLRDILSNTGVSPFSFTTAENEVFLPDGSNMPNGNNLLALSASTERVNWRTGDVLQLTGNITNSTALVQIHLSHANGVVDGDPTQNLFTTFRVKLISTSQEYTGTEPDESWLAEIHDRDKVYEDDFVCFAYRYKYVDGEYSAISPYSNVAFKAGFYSYNPIKGFNGGMVNRAKSIKVSDFIPPHTPRDVEKVQLLFKKTNSALVNVIRTYERNSFDWNIQGTIGSNYKGALEISSEVFGAALGEDQSLRIFDNVPVKARSQEFSSSRLLYGNYHENYNVQDESFTNIDPRINSGFESLFTDFTASFESSSNMSSTQPSVAPEGNDLDSDLMYQISTDLTPGIPGGLQSMTPNFNPQDFTINYAEGTNDTVSNPFGGLPATIEVDPSNAYSNVIPGSNLVSLGWRCSEGPYYEASVSGSYTFKASVDVKFMYAQFTALADKPASHKGLFFGLARTTSSGEWLDHENLHGDNGDYNSVTINEANPNILHIEAVSGNNLNTTVNFFNNGAGPFQSFSFEKTVYLNAGEKVAAGFIGSHKILSLTNDAYYNTLSGAAFDGIAGNFLSLPILNNSYFAVTSSPGEVDTFIGAQAKSSVKSDREYQVGVVYSDEYGRESSVLIGNSKGLKITKESSNTQNRIFAKIQNKAPYWAKHYKFYLKEIAEEYHNIVLYKAYSTGGLNDDNDADGNINFVWLAFNSADVNKVSKGSYLIHKKQHGNTTAVLDPSAKYRVLDIIGNATIDEEEISVGGLDLDALGATFDDVNGKFFVKIETDNNFVLNIGDGESITNDENVSSGAVFEVVKTTPVDIDLFYEVSQAFPIYLDKNNASTIIKAGDVITLEEGWSQNEFNNWSLQNLAVVAGEQSAYSLGQSNVQFNESGSVIVTLQENFNYALNAGSDANKTLRFTRPDGSYYILAATGLNLAGNTIRIYPFTHKTSQSNFSSKHLLNFFNCFTFGNGVESDRVRDDFNANVIYPYTSVGKASGFKASLPDDDYKRNHKKNDIIFSQIKNEVGGLNRTNEFLMAENIVKRLSSEYGSIQKLFTRNTDVIAFCEGKVLKILANKDALFNADGNSQLLSSTNVLGQAVPFTADYGISKNPESFAVDEFRSYFVDKDRGAVLRLSRDGISAISDFGMKDFFRDNLKDSVVCIGSYDRRKEEYNLTIHTYDSPNPSNKNVYTLSYSESAKGWISFKSWIKESGVSLSNDYYTFKNSKMHLHHVNSKFHNNFYGTQQKSTITPIFNDSSGTVKHFDTVSYEGTQSKVIKFTNEVVDGVTYNDGEYYNAVAKNGWHIESIVTDLQEGYIDEFIDKENKWFNYIKGISTSHTNLADGDVTSNLDFNEINMQGIGDLSANATSNVGGFSEGHDINVSVSNSDNAQWSSAGYEIYNQSSYPGTATFVIIPNAGYAVGAANFSITNSLPIWITSVSFSDSTIAGTADNTVIGTITFSGQTLSSDVSHSLQIDTVAAPTAMLWTGNINIYGSGIGQQGGETFSLTLNDDFVGQLIGPTIENGYASYFVIAYISSQANNFSPLLKFSANSGVNYFYPLSNLLSTSVSPISEAENYNFEQQVPGSLNAIAATTQGVEIEYAYQGENVGVDQDNIISIYTNSQQVQCEFNSYIPDASNENTPTATFDDNGGFNNVGLVTNVGTPSVKVVATDDDLDWLTPQTITNYIQQGGGPVLGQVTSEACSFTLSQNNGNTRDLELHLFSAINNTNTPDDILAIKQQEADVINAGIQIQSIINEVGNPDYGQVYDNLNGTTFGSGVPGPKLTQEAYPPFMLRVVADCNVQAGDGFSDANFTITYSDPANPFAQSNGPIPVYGPVVPHSGNLNVSFTDNNGSYAHAPLILLENETTQDRTLTITVTHPSDSSVSKTIIVTQKAAYSSADNTLRFLNNIGGLANSNTSPNFDELEQFFNDVDPEETVEISANGGYKELYIKIPNEDYQFIQENATANNELAGSALPSVSLHEAQLAGSYNPDEGVPGWLQSPGIDENGNPVFSGGDEYYVTETNVGTFSLIPFFNGFVQNYYGINLAQYYYEFNFTENNYIIPGNSVPDTRKFEIRGKHPFNNTGQYDSKIKIKQPATPYAQFLSIEDIVASDTDNNGNYVVNIPGVANNGTPQFGQWLNGQNIYSDEDYTAGNVPAGLISYALFEQTTPTWLIESSVNFNSGTSTTQDYNCQVVVQPNFTGFTREVNVKVVNANSTFDFNINGPAIDDTFQQSRKIIIPGAIGFLYLGDQNLSPFIVQNFLHTGTNNDFLVNMNESEEIPPKSLPQSQGNVSMSTVVNFNGPVPYVANIKIKEQGEEDYTFITDEAEATWISVLPNISTPTQNEVSHKLKVSFTGTGGDPGSILKFDVIHGANQNLVKSYTIFRA